MIQNLILDVGGVLVKWAPADYAQKAASNASLSGDDALRLKQALYDHPDWFKGDQGLLDNKGLYEAARGRLPERLHPALNQLVFTWMQWLDAMPGADIFVRRAKKAGLTLYILSNAGEYFPKSLEKFPFYPLFSGYVVSCEEKVTKPDADIFNILLDRFHLDASTCFFVDDLAKNVEGAKAVGIDGCLFNGNFDALIKALQNRGISI